MPGEGASDPMAATTALGKTSASDGASDSEAEDLVSITRTDGQVNHDTASPLSEATSELDLRLREQTAENAKLDTELRYLQAELAVRKEFITHLENECETVRAQSSRYNELEAEFRAYRNRLSHRVTDRLASIIHELPWLYRPLKLVSRAVAALVSRSGSHRSP